MVKESLQKLLHTTNPAEITEKMAPCVDKSGNPVGEVNTTDFDTKDAVCKCSDSTCLVDGRNIVILKTS